MITAAIIQARMSSSRLPGKSMIKICSKPIIEHVFDRVKSCKLIDDVILATSIDPSDDILEEWAVNNSINCYRGSLDDVLDRFYNASIFYKVDNIVRITADCPLVDPNLIDKLFRYFKSKKVSYASNTNPPSFPDGFDIEIFDFNSLKEAFKKTKNIKDLEHVTPFLIRNKKFKKYNLRNKKNLSNYKLSIDSTDDFIKVEKIFNIFGNFNVNYKEIIKRL